jgi:hypothetical protein
MAEVLCVYQEVAIVRAAEAADAAKACHGLDREATDKTEPNVAFVSYDEKPGIQAISNTAPDLPPVAGEHACVARDHEYKRHGTLSLLAGIDLLSGQVHACVEDRHRSREFIGFLKKLDTAYPADTAIKIILGNQKNPGLPRRPQSRTHWPHLVLQDHRAGVIGVVSWKRCPLMFAISSSRHRKYLLVCFKLYSMTASGQSRRHDHETTVDHALIRGLVTAGR